MSGFVRVGSFEIPESALTAAERREQITTCEAATLVERDGQTGIFCGVAKEFIAITESPIVTGAWCCGDGIHKHPTKGCPTWLKRDQVDAHKKALRQRETDRETARQIASGARVDDRGLEQGSAIFADPFDRG